MYLAEGLKPDLKDNSQSWEMNADGHCCHKPVRGSKRPCAQEALLAELAATEQG